jgi:hypothetical protein
MPRDREGRFGRAEFWAGDDTEAAARVWAEWRDDLRHLLKCREQLLPPPEP